MPKIQYAQGLLTNDVSGVMESPDMASMPQEVFAKAQANLMQEFDQLQKDQDAVYAIKNVAEAKMKAVQAYTEAELSAGENPEGFAKGYTKSLDDQLNSYLESAPNERVKAMMFQDLSGTRSELMQRSAYFEHRARREYMEEQARQAIKLEKESLKASNNPKKDLPIALDRADLLTGIMAGKVTPDELSSLKKRERKHLIYDAAANAIDTGNERVVKEIISNNEYNQYLTEAQVKKLAKLQDKKIYQKQRLEQARLKDKSFKEALDRFKGAFKE